MPSSLQTINTTFAESIGQSRVLYRHCLTPKGLHTNTGVEAAFLQIQKSWERFLEDLFLSVLCGERPTRKPLASHFVVKDLEIARRILFNGRPYVEWTRFDDVMGRVNTYLEVPNIVETTLSSIAGEIEEIKTIRNFIAHSSKKAKEEFERLCRKKIGTTSTITSAAEYLLFLKEPNPPESYFEHYALILEVAAKEMVA